MIVSIIVIIILTIIVFSLIYYNKKKINQIKQECSTRWEEQEEHIYNNIKERVEEEFIKTRKKELEEYLLIESAKEREMANLRHEAYMAHLREEQQRLEQIICTGNETIRQLEQRKEEQTKLINETIAARKETVDTEVAKYLEVETHKARTALDAETQAMRKFAEEGMHQYWDGLAQSSQELQVEIEQAKSELEDYKKKQQAINEAIRRQRELEEKQDFYRVCLSEFTIEDINLLQEIRQKLHTSESLNKLIYDVYVGKQVQEMVKRVLQGSAPSGIYKITRLKTGEIYIGKSTNVKDRWVQHCKTVFGAGTIARSMLHTTMQKDGIQNFTFELVEEVPKDKLTEREKYWIAFYGSKEYGLNEKAG